MKFSTNYSYIDRYSKARYIWEKYQSILTGSILDVGADECFLKGYLNGRSTYVGIDKGGHPDIKVDLQLEKIPYPDNAFDCVVCTDVLEHLDNLHSVFDELCRVSRKWVILSLPNSWREFYLMMCSGYYQPDRPLKFNHLPVDTPLDRHKWFFSGEEAEKFIIGRSRKKGMQIIQIDIEGIGSEGKGMGGWLRKFAVRFLFKTSINFKNLYSGTTWAVLEKRV